MNAFSNIFLKVLSFFNIEVLSEEEQPIRILIDNETLFRQIMKDSGNIKPEDLVNEALTLYTAILYDIYKGRSRAKIADEKTGELVNISLPGFVFAQDKFNEGKDTKHVNQLVPKKLRLVRDGEEDSRQG